ncbi:MAG: ATP phosphoribosyltransferase [Methanomicrobiales archaeon]|nr:ATP phosphoribosyltransferase [Methanomicrobiales archaeon]
MASSKHSELLRLAIPNKGRIAPLVRELVEKGGLHLLDGDDRRLVAKTLDPAVEVLFARAIDIPAYVESGAADLGITGRDMVAEKGSKVEEILDLKIGKARLVVAVPEGSTATSVRDLGGVRIATEFPLITSSFFREKGVPVSLIPVGGACEATPELGIADAIVDLVSSGTTLRSHHLRILEIVMETSTVLIANHESLLQAGEKIEEIALALESVIRARGQCYLMMNVRRSAVEEIKKILPGLSGPTVMEVASSEDLVAVHVVVAEERIYRLISQLRKAGGRDILVIPIERMIR